MEPRDIADFKKHKDEIRFAMWCGWDVMWPVVAYYTVVLTVAHVLSLLGII